MQKENAKQFFEEDERSIRRLNRDSIKKDVDCQKNIDDLRQIEKFIMDMVFLSFGRDFIFSNSGIFSLHSVMTSLELTMGSIISCCENGCIADANSLLRKYRDDMFFYLYILVYNSNLNRFDKSSTNDKMESKISAWIKNELKDLKISEVLKSIANSEYLKDAIKKYNLKESFNEISEYLNNYVHSNGYIYYNKSIGVYKDREVSAELSKLVKNAKYITIVFIFLMTLCAPYFIMSTDYVDYLDFDETPPEDSQYWIAPFVLRFIEENINLIDENCIEYLKNNTNMKFDM